jgi:uncharacterized membrane protein
MFETDEKEKAESKPLEKIQLKHLIIAFLILGIGCFVALIVFVLEMIGKGKVHEAQQTNKRENLNIESFSDQ